MSIGKHKIAFIALTDDIRAEPYIMLSQSGVRIKLNSIIWQTDAAITLLTVTFFF